ncbi:putative 40s ribosomal protein [Phaeomoniella chlamydospora]|uniref:Putative 40s ribosomal protein n=1 Tax=Phaeomoniella chlamydospora TaxID=158046 RepID=A0A0G2DY57_PHACM|nr:putative 40s ribosomal protein [Phaeomoniella chlamydospora]
MIVRQFCARHGRSALRSSRPSTLDCVRSFASRLEPHPSQETTSPVEEQKEQRPTLPSDPKKKIWSNTNAFYRARTAKRKGNNIGARNRGVIYNPQEFESNPLSVEEIDLPTLLACQTHLGQATSLWNPRNSSYISGVRDGIHIISLDVTAAYLRRACKVVEEVARRGGLILFVGTRDGQQELVVRSAKLAGGFHVFDKWVPGSLTNGQQILGHCKLQIVDAKDKEITRLRPLLRDQPVSRPDLVVCLNPLENEVCLHECGLYNVPTIGIVDTDADASWVTYPIPANDDSLRSVTLIAGALGRSGQAGQKERLKLAEEGIMPYPPVDLKNLTRFSGEVGTEA